MGSATMRARAVVRRVGLPGTGFHLPQRPLSIAAVVFDSLVFRGDALFLLPYTFWSYLVEHADSISSDSAGAVGGSLVRV